MGTTVQYILEQERLKKQQEQEVVPAVSPVTNENGEVDTTVEVEQPQQPIEDIEEQFPNVSAAYQDMKAQNNSVLPGQDNGAAMAVLEDRKAQQQVEAQESTEVQQEAPQERYPNKPTNWTDEEYEAVRRLKSDEEIQSIFSNPDPNDFLNGIATQSYRQNTRQPVEPDEKQMKRQRMFAGIGDVLSLLSQAAGHSMGARQKERSFEQSAMGMLAPKQQKLYDNYLTRADDYNKGLVNAKMKDYLQGHSDWKSTQKDVQGILDTHRKEKIAEKKQEQNENYKRQQLKARADQLEETKRRNDAYIRNSKASSIDRSRSYAISERNTAVTEARLKHSIDKWEAEMEEKKTGKPAETKKTKAEFAITIPAHANDAKAEQTELGERVRTIEMTNSQKEKYVRDALDDNEFRAKYPDLFKQGYNKELTKIQRDDIAAMYLQDKYEDTYSGGGGGLAAPVQTPDPVLPPDTIAPPTNVPDASATEIERQDEAEYNSLEGAAQKIAWNNQESHFLQGQINVIVRGEAPEDMDEEAEIKRLRAKIERNNKRVEELKGSIKKPVEKPIDPVQNTIDSISSNIDIDDEFPIL